MKQLDVQSGRKSRKIGGRIVTARLVFLLLLVKCTCDVRAFISIGMVVHGRYLLPTTRGGRS